MALEGVMRPMVSPLFSCRGFMSCAGQLPDSLVPVAAADVVRGAIRPAPAAIVPPLRNLRLFMFAT